MTSNILLSHSISLTSSHAHQYDLMVHYDENLSKSLKWSFNTKKDILKVQKIR